MKRSFTIVDFPEKGNEYGRYLSKSPHNAASKAFSQLARIVNLKNSNKKNHLVFSIRETTQGSNNKVYTYIGTRVELNEPITKNIAGRQVVYRYKNIISKYREGKEGL